MAPHESFGETQRYRRGFPHVSVRPRPAIGEAAQCYLARVAAANGYAQPKTLWNLLRTTGWSGLPLLRVALRLPRHRVAMLVGPFPTYTEIRIDSVGAPQKDDFNHRYLRWCPACLRDAAYMRGEWALKLRCVCSVHRIILHDRCPRCDELQDIPLGSMTCRHCLANLADAKLQLASAEVLKLHLRLVKILQGNGAQQDRFTFRQLSVLIKHLGQFGSGMPKRRSGQIAGLDRLDVALPLLSRAAHLLSNWPFHFHLALTEVRARSVASASLKRTFGSWYRAMYVDLHEYCFQFLRDAFEEYVRTQWPNLIAKRNRRLSSKTIASKSHRPLKILAQETGVSRATLKRLASNGLIAASPVKHASGRTTWAFPKSITQKVKSIANDTIDLKQTAKLLGIPKSRVKELIDAGLIKVWIRAGSMRASAWSLCKQDVRSLCTPPTYASNEAVQQVSLRQVLKTWRLREGELPALLQACSSRALSAIGSPKIDSSLSDLSFDVEALRTWLDEYRRKLCNRTFSVDETGKMLGVRQQVAYELVRSGLLETFRSGDPALRGARITMQTICEFREKFVSLSALSLLNGCRSRTLLSQISVKPVIGPNIDGSRQYFYSRRDVATYLKGN